MTDQKWRECAIMSLVEQGITEPTEEQIAEEIEEGKLLVARAFSFVFPPRTAKRASVVTQNDSS